MDAIKGVFAKLAPKWVLDLVVMFGLAVVYGIAVERQGGGPEKKKEVIAALKKQMAEPGGIDLPSWLLPYEDMILSALVEAAVMLIKRVDLVNFLEGKSSGSSTTP